MKITTIISKIEAEIAEGFGLIGGFIAMSSIGVIGYQCLLWLIDGYWTPVRLRLAWHWFGGADPDFQWGGVQKIAWWILGWPLSITLAVIGIIIFLISVLSSPVVADE